MCLYVSVFWCWLSHQSITNWWIEERIEPINPSTVHVLISGAYSLTVKYNDPTKGVTAKHYRIRNLDNGGFYISTRITFNALEKLVAHYMSKIYFSHWGTLIRNSHLNPGISCLSLHYLDLTNSSERYLKRTCRWKVDGSQKCCRVGVTSRRVLDACPPIVTI